MGINVNSVGGGIFFTFITLDSISFLTKVDNICWYGVQKSRSHSLSRSKNIKNNFTECPKMMCNIRINQIFQKCFGSFKYLKIWIQYYIQIQLSSSTNLTNSIFCIENQIPFSPLMQRSVVIIKSKTHHKWIESGWI